jgi:micrococcal nuclease
MLKRALMLALVTACAAPARPEPLPIVRDCAPGGFVALREPVWTGAATAIIDGDSFCLGEAEIRLQRFDAPEWDEAGGPEARDALGALLARGPVTCEARARSYDRVIAACSLVDGKRIEDALKVATRARDGP